MSPIKAKDVRNSSLTIVALVLLLLVISIINAYTPLYNIASPNLGGLPFFYWFQIILLPISTVLYLIFSYIEHKREASSVGVAK